MKVERSVRCENPLEFQSFALSSLNNTYILQCLDFDKQAFAYLVLFQEG